MRRLPPRPAPRTASARASSRSSRRVPLPAGLDVKDPEQALQQFVNQSPWDEQAVLRRYRATMAETFASPDGHLRHRRHHLPQAGQALRRRPAAVLRRPGQEGQLPGAPSASTTSAPKGHYPLDMRLYLPECWLGDPERLDKAGVPEAERRSLTKGQIALELLDRVRAEGLPGGLVRGRRRLRRLGAVPRRPGRARACTTSSA